MTCDRSQQVHAFHDGELPAGDRDALQAHLQSCPECSGLLVELRALSRMFGTTLMVEASADTMERIRERQYVMPDAGVLRIAGWLTAAAAAVLLAALPMWRPARTVETPAVANADVLDTVAVTPPSDPENSPNEVVALAQWMADDLSVKSRQ